ncbi:hypothetical protein ACG3JJ_09710 [Streptococcus parauberis]|uniref:hypothetical protein n=1 Tax=Streptococcus parauberis TaxID=1348 RepID=UPI00044B561F|nr:hypothetical protein [Streptococcus parauberis]QBX10015.1 hypothetical protein JavanS403_0016 [Streptococcus satellite phage Javan403]UWM90614.1 hypothetical protein N2A94_08935 [Streptococcus parauberis]WEM62781.1 hypothetical protein P1T44_07105 [Streptococcus parauberis]GAJ60811.1 phage-related protein-like protein [Streptococcus parauberis]
MVEIKEIKEQIEKVKKEHEDYSIYTFQIKKIQNELDELNNKEDSPGKKSKVLRLQKEIAKLEIKETENAMEAYQELVSSFNAIPSLIDIYFSEQLNNDKEAQRLGQEYNEAKKKLINLAVEHNVRLKEKLDQLKKEIVATGFYELDREISDNKIVGQLGYRTPETNYIRFYKSDDKEILVPNELVGLYEEALRKREAVKGNKPKTGLLSKLMK